MLCVRRRVRVEEVLMERPLGVGEGAMGRWAGGWVRGCVGAWVGE